MMAYTRKQPIPSNQSRHNQWQMVCLVFLSLVSVPIHSQIIAVVNRELVDMNPDLPDILQAASPLQMKVVIAKSEDSKATFYQVCGALQNRASLILDVSTPAVGPLLSSLARANGLVFLSVIDQSFILTVDQRDQRFMVIQPPGSTMLKIIEDIVIFDNLTNVAILYDNSFNLDQIPRRVVSGLLTHHIYQKIHGDTIEEVLAGMKTLETRNIFMVATKQNVDMVFRMVGKVDGVHPEHSLNSNNINWFVITKDSTITCTYCKKEIKIIVLDGSFTQEKKIEYTNFLGDHDIYKVEARIDEAFLYDLMGILSTIGPSPAVSGQAVSCNTTVNILDETTVAGRLLIQNLTKVKYEGVFGPIIYSDATKSLLQKVHMKIKRFTFKEGQESSKITLGHWTLDGGLNLTVPSLIEERPKKSYKVVVVPQYEPFIYRHVNSANGTATYSGFCMDLFYAIAKELDFDYELIESGSSFGSLNEDGTWNGAITMLLEKNADIAIGPISVMSERENVVDFTVPFHEPVGLTILMKKHKFDYSLHKFLTVLDADVWGCIVASYFLFSVLMWLFDKFSPYSYQNDPDTTAGGEKRIFTFKEGIWFCMTSLTPQGGGEAPKALSGRLVAATWWLYGFLLIAFYTAKLAAILTVTRFETPIASIEDLAQQQSVKYGPLNGTSSHIYFQRMTMIEEQFYRIWKDMSLNDSLSPVARAKLAVWDYPVSEQFTKLMDRMYVPQTYSEAYTMVKNGEFAFIADATRNKYQTLIDCDMEEIGEEFSRKPFAFAVQQGSPLRTQISNVILELSNNRIIEEMTSRWWDQNAHTVDCPNIDDESDGISIKNIGGVFLLIAMGTGLSLIAFVVEYYYYKIKPDREARLYDIYHRTTHFGRQQSEISLDDVQIQDNGRESTGAGTKKRGNNATVKENGVNVNNGNSTGHETMSPRVNGNFRCSKIQGSRNNLGPSHENGHCQQGEDNPSYFTFDSEDTIAERYHYATDNGGIEATEKL